ncbi:tetratricopeptide repeat protein [Terrisporobacter sp.]
MKRKFLLILMIIIVFATGCAKITENKLFMQGEEKLEGHQYDEALTLLSEVLRENPNNQSARTMYMQARKMYNAQEYENKKDYKRAIRELDAIVNINNGSQKIKREAINKKAQLEKLKEEKEQKSLQRKENAKKNAKESNSKLNY